MRKQLAKADGRFFNAANECVIRLVTPLEMRYEEAYVRAHPFNRLVDGMLQPEMVLETVEIIKRAVEQRVTVYVIVNNRVAGNAPLIAQQIAEKYLAKPETPAHKDQLSLW